VADVLRLAPHTLDAKGEAILASFGLVQGQAGSIYGILSNADMPWPTVKLADGKEVKLDQAAYTHYREVPNRDDRKKVMDAFFGQWKVFEATIGTALYSNLKEDSVYAKVRQYPDAMTASLDANNLPRAVYDALIKSANANLPTLHRYFRLRGKMLGVPEMRYYDIYPPLVSGGRAYPIDEGIKMMVESVAPLGPEYQAAMKKGVADRWMDVYPRPKKLSGAHMAGYAYDVHPYLLINYTDNYESVTTIAHEWGHAMHSYYSNQEPAVRDRQLRDLHRRDRLHDERGFAARLRPQEREERRRAPALPRLRAREPARHVLSPGDVRGIRGAGARAGRQGRAAHRRALHQDLWRDPAPLPRRGAGRAQGRTTSTRPSGPTSRTSTATSTSSSTRPRSPPARSSPRRSSPASPARASGTSSSSRRADRTTRTSW
jgi:hypothetical protein